MSFRVLFYLKYPKAAVGSVYLSTLEDILVEKLCHSKNKEIHSRVVIAGLRIQEIGEVDTEEISSAEVL